MRTPDWSKDQELINILKENARTPLATVAKKLKVSRATVQARLNRLEREGIITGYTVTTRHDTGSNDTLSAIIMVEIRVKSQTGVVSELKKIPEIVSCHTLSGQFDLIVTVKCRLASQLDAVIDLIAEMDGVSRTASSIMLSTKFER